MLPEPSIPAKWNSRRLGVSVWHQLFAVLTHQTGSYVLLAGHGDELTVEMRTYNDDRTFCHTVAGRNPQSPNRVTISGPREISLFEDESPPTLEVSGSFWSGDEPGTASKSRCTGARFRTMALAIILGAAALAWWAIGSLHRMRHNREYHSRLREAPLEELTKRCAEAVLSEQWERLDAGRSIVDGENWTERSLLDALNVLWTKITEEDGGRGRTGRDSNYFEFYDSGLAGITEALHDRLGIPHSWERGH